MKKTQTILTLIFILVAIFSGLSGNLQTVKKDTNGNYYAVKNPRTDSVKVTETGKTYTDLNGVKYKVFLSVNNKLFIYRVAKTSGNLYKYYGNYTHLHARDKLSPKFPNF